MSDITLDGDLVIVDGHQAILRVEDVVIDSAARRKREGGWRRALVHDENDGLTINFNSDYPGGVTVQGKTKLDSVIISKQATLHEVIVDRRVKDENGMMRMPTEEHAHAPSSIGGMNIPDGVYLERIDRSIIDSFDRHLVIRPEYRQRRALQHNSNDGLTINVDSDYPGGVTINGDVMLPGKLVVNGQDVAATIKSHEERIKKLEEQVAKILAGGGIA